jgi:hypothetical protein
LKGTRIHANHFGDTIVMRSGHASKPSGALLNAVQTELLSLSQRALDRRTTRVAVRSVSGSSASKSFFLDCGD